MSIKYFFLPEMVVCAECIKVDKKTHRMRPVEDDVTIKVDDHAVAFVMECPKCKARGVVKMPINTGEDKL
jgi:hypothetical protein